MASRRSTAISSRSRTTELRRPWPPPAETLPFLLLALAACGGDGLLLPSAGQPSRITVVSGDGQTGTVGQPLGEPFVVRVSDPEDRPVQGVEVAFMAPEGAVLSPDDTVLTGPDGQAAVHYTLAPTAGDQTVEARARPVVPTSSLNTIFRASARPEAASSLVPAAGNEQVGPAGAPLPDSLAVRAVDRFGNGVSGVEITWEASGGTVSPTSVATGSDGRAAAERVLGDRPGTYATTASAAGLEGSPISFTATAVPPPSPQLALATQPSTTARAGIPFARQPVVQLQDALGVPLRRADVTVTVQIASGSGSLGGRVTARSNADGVASFTDLSIRGETGKRTLIFAASDFTSAISPEIDVSAGPPLPAASSVTVPNGTAGERTEISIRLEDAFGSPVSGAASDIAISVEGANSGASLEVTDRGGGDYIASYVPIRAGTDNVDVRVAGERVGSSPFASTIVAGPADPATTTASVTKSGVIFFFRVDILVTTRDAHGNVLGRGGERVEIQVNGSPRPSPVDRGDGTYSDSFSTLNPNLEIAIALNGVPISGSPFRP